jgi:hypothetical protein
LRTPILFWNELSFPDNIRPEELGTGGPWCARARESLDGLLTAFGLQSRARVSVPKGTIHASFAGKPFIAWLQECLGRDGTRKILGRVIQPNLFPDPEQGFLCELRLEARVGEGLKKAHLSDSWVWSLGCKETLCMGATIETLEYRVNSDGDESEAKAVVRNLANSDHTDHWQDLLISWGLVESPNAVVAEHQGYRVVIYPYDHGYPHIHLKKQDQPDYKYRIDKFEPLTNSPKALDDAMGLWVAEHSASLLESWRRSQKGLRPLKVASE